ncbi:MAG: hypothetical protein QNI98_03630 [Woeseiaceae bacterium]|nr:hypothetical protein [Woeseiaceae bacterium]
MGAIGLMRARKTITFILVVLVLVGVSIVVAYSAFLKGLFHAATTIQESGRAVVLAGNRHVTVEFDTEFPTAPIVVISGNTPTNVMAFATEVSAKTMRIQLSERTESRIAFYWDARWTRQEWSHFDDTERAPTREFYVRQDDQEYAARVTGTSLQRPTEIFVSGPTTTLDSELSDRLIVAANEVYRSEVECGWVDKLRLKIKLRARDCPPRRLYERLPITDLPDSENWAQTLTAGGVLLIDKTYNPADVSLDVAASKLADLWRQTQAADLMQHNNQVLDFIQSTTAAGITDSNNGLTVIRFDTHSDLRAYASPLGYTPQEHIGDFLDTLIGDGFVSEVYWVMPDWTRHRVYADDFHNADTSRFSDSPYSNVHYVQGPSTLEIYVARNTGELHFMSPPEHLLPEEVKRVNFHKVLLDELPDFSDRENIYLEMDADYWSNVGYHTHAGAGHDPTSTELAGSMIRVFDTLLSLGVKPRIASMCLSPAFTANEDRAAMARVFIDALDQSGLDDQLIGYHHVEAYGHVGEASNVLRTSSLSKLLLQLYRLDASTMASDERINIGDRDSETDNATNLIVQALGVTDKRAHELLMHLDRLDGQLDGALDLADIEYYSAFEGPPTMLKERATVVGE